MDIWEDDNDELTTSKTYEEKEWTRISETFHNDGYREGITSGKESALQEGFDNGFNNVGVPIGAEIGTLRGVATGLLAFLASQTSAIGNDIHSRMLAEAQDIVNQLNRFWLEDIVPPDTLADEHEKVHGGEDGMSIEQSDGQEEGMDDISSAFQNLGTTDSKARKAQRREEALQSLRNTKERLKRVLYGLGLSIPLE